ncbi:MAG: prepilin-type N-terminal cleavage/methylation domain-containing protein, partial [bacterium]|nr:prepilin-type N-terminal cleavage/methylation domain-containing protein [bacterium]
MISLGHKCKKGFTLIELLVVVAIIGILTSIGV